MLHPTKRKTQCDQFSIESSSETIGNSIHLRPFPKK
jgi:hypothetical protein